MKWYETPVEELYESAIEALGRNDEDSYKENLLHAYTLIREREFQKVRASENLENTSSCYEEPLPLSTYDEKRVRLEHVAKVVKRDMYDLLTMSVVVYRVFFSDEDLLGLLKGAAYRFRKVQCLRALAVCAADSDDRVDRYTREMYRCNQVICRIQRERRRRKVNIECL